MKIIIKLLVLCLMTFSVTAKPVDPVKLYGTLPEFGQLSISPSGDRVAVRQTTPNMDRVIIIDTKSNKPMDVIQVDKVKPQNIYFVDNNTLILRVQSEERLSGFNKKYQTSSAIAYNIEKRKLFHLLSKGNGIYPNQVSLGNIVGISKDGQHAFMPAYSSYDRYSLMRVKLNRKSKPKIISKGTAHASDYFMGDDDEVIARVQFDDVSNIFQIDSRVTGRWKPIYKERTAFITKGIAGVTPDKKALVVLEENSDTGRTAYYTLDLTTGEFSAPLFDFKDKDVEGVISDINRVVYGVRLSGFTPSYEFFDTKLNARVKSAMKAIPGASVAIADYSPDWKNILFFEQGGNSAGSYYLLYGNKLQHMIDAYSNIADNYVHSITEFEYQARDGLTIPTLLTWPNTKAKKNLPTIMMPHGGPEAYDRIQFDWLAQYFAHKGYLVVQPQFRGSDGFGAAHLRKGRGKWGREMQDDLTDAIHVLAEQGTTDPDKVCIVGASYGGYAALAGAAFTPDLYKCVVSINGVSDVQRMLDAEKRMYGKNHWVVSYWTLVMKRGTFEEDHLSKISPFNAIDKITSPVLLIHGEKDRVVPVKQSKLMLEAMKKQQKDVTYVELPDGSHYLDNAQNRLNALTAIEEFLSQTMGE